MGGWSALTNRGAEKVRGVGFSGGSEEEVHCRLGNRLTGNGVIL